MGHVEEHLVMRVADWYGVGISSMVWWVYLQGAAWSVSVVGGWWCRVEEVKSVWAEHGRIWYGGHGHAGLRAHSRLEFGICYFTNGIFSFAGFWMKCRPTQMSTR